MVDGEDGIVDESAGAERSGSAAVSELESSGGDGGEAGEGIVGGEDGGAGAEMLKLAGAGDGIGEGEGVGVVDGEDAVVGDEAGDGAGGVAITELECAGGDGGEAGVGVVVGGEDGGAGGPVVEAGRSAGDCGQKKRQRIGMVDGEGAVVADATDDEDPDVEPFPSWRTPAAMVVTPVKVLSAVMVVVPSPRC